MNNTIIYSLPEAVWVYCSTILSKKYFIGVGDYKIKCRHLPIFYAVALEFFQLSHLTNGYFDWNDILLSTTSWILATITIIDRHPEESLLGGFDFRKISCVSIYIIVYLSHVPNL